MKKILYLTLSFAALVLSLVILVADDAGSYCDSVETFEVKYNYTNDCYENQTQGVIHIKMDDIDDHLYIGSIYNDQMTDSYDIEQLKSKTQFEIESGDLSAGISNFIVNTTECDHGGTGYIRGFVLNLTDANNNTITCDGWVDELTKDQTLICQQTATQHCTINLDYIE